MLPSVLLHRGPAKCGLPSHFGGGGEGRGISRHSKTSGPPKPVATMARIISFMGWSLAPSVTPSSRNEAGWQTGGQAGGSGCGKTAEFGLG